LSDPIDMNPKKADNVAYVYGLKERKRLAAVKESNAFIGVAVAASKANEKQERKRLVAEHTEQSKRHTEHLLMLLSCLFFAF
jgi:hypothetical protein